MTLNNYSIALSDIPVDLFADPDGVWTYETLVAAAGLDPDAIPAPVIGALSEPFRGHPDGAAVVAGMANGEAVVAIVDCGATTFVAA